MVVGITGGVATGKSVVTQLLKAHGCLVFSADEAARAVTAANGPVLKALVTTFGPQILRPDGALNRSALGVHVFADPDARAQLNRIMHPAILRLLRAQIDAALEDIGARLPIVVEVPLLFETNLADWFERIVVVIASEPTQIARLKARNALSEAEVMDRLASQWPVAEKAARADYVISNEGSLAELESSVDDLWEKSMQFGSKGD